MYIFLAGNLPSYRASPGSHREKNTLEELEVHIMAKEVYTKVLPLYFKANAKLSPPVIMTEAVFAQKLVRVWNDVNTILWKQKKWANIKKKLEAQLDKLFDLINCQYSILFVEVVTGHLHLFKMLPQEDYVL